jgi:hypothetical protein
LGKGKSKGDKEDASAVAGGAFSEEGLEKIERVPNCITEYDDGGRRDDYADEGGYCEADGDGKKLGPQSVLRLDGKSCKIRIVL